MHPSAPPRGTFAQPEEAPLTTTPAPPESAPQSRSVRDRLTDAAEECLRVKGIRSTTVSEVAEVAGVSRGWLYRHFPDKVTLLGAALVRLNDAYWSESHALLDEVQGLAEQIAAGISHARTAYDDPGALLMKLRMAEPEEFAACAGAGVQGLVPDLAAFWRRYVVAARDAGEIHPDVHVDEAAEWVARAILSLTTVPGAQLDAADPAAVLVHVKRYVMPGLRTDPAV